MWYKVYVPDLTSCYKLIERTPPPGGVSIKAVRDYTTMVLCDVTSSTLLYWSTVQLICESLYMKIIPCTRSDIAQHHAIRQPMYHTRPLYSLVFNKCTAQLWEYAHKDLLSQVHSWEIVFFTRFTCEGLWQIPLKMLHPRNPSNPETQISLYHYTLTPLRRHAPSGQVPTHQKKIPGGWDR